MKPKHWKFTGLCLALIVSLLIAGAVVAQSAGYDLTWWSVDSGGGTSSGPGYTVTGAGGQPDAGRMSGGIYDLQGGFWSGAANQISAGFNIYLPSVMK